MPDQCEAGKGVGRITSLACDRKSVSDGQYPKGYGDAANPIHIKRKRQACGPLGPWCTNCTSKNADSTATVRAGVRGGYVVKGKVGRRVVFSRLLFPIKASTWPVDIKSLRS